MPGVPSRVRRVLTFMLASGAALALGVPGCLGRSGLDDPDSISETDASGGAQGSGGSGARGGTGTGGASTGGSFGTGVGGGSVGGAGGAVGVGGAAGVGAAGGGGSEPGGASGAGGRVGAAGNVGAGGSFGDGGSFGAGGSDGSGGTGGQPGCGACDGCCDRAGQCRPGTAANACGLTGVACVDCSELGFGCVSGRCEGAPPSCGPATCTGCCDARGLCRFGSEIDACGSRGVACRNCSDAGRDCVNERCQGTPEPCSPANCGGCCSANGVCLTGTSDTTCGAKGEACQNCRSVGRVCTQPGSYCAFFPTCGSVTCPTGCCDERGDCASGRSDSACGNSGQACADCSASGQACAAQGFCYSGTHCGPDNCAGCCTANGLCRPGSGSANCGQFGALCDNCVAKGETCQNRVCSDGSVCPAPYPGCSPGSLTPPPVSSRSCSNAELERLAQACAGQSPGPACTRYFESLLRSNASCYDCMLQFAGPDAYTRCVAPFLTPGCNHDLTCAIDCSDASCSGCSASNEASCQARVFEQDGACRPWTNGYFCLQAAIEGPGRFCDFDQYGDVGRWWQAAGQHYCQ
jgi:hypothetical protein